MDIIKSRSRYRQDDPELVHLDVLASCTCPADPCLICDFARDGLAAIRYRRQMLIQGKKS